MISRISTLLVAASLGVFTAACGDGADDGGADMSADTAASAGAVEQGTPAPAAETATTNPMVGGAEMFPSKNIVDNAVNSADHTTLVSAVTAAGLVETLKGPGPFTVFAPTNAAFEKVPADALGNLMKPESKDALTGILTYHVVSGRVDAAALASEIEKGGGKATLTTVAGGTLTAAIENGAVVITDAKGGKATVTQADVMQSNGVIHVIDTVLMPA